MLTTTDASSSSDQLEVVRSAFQSWRDSLQGRRSRIPGHLWHAAASLLDHLPITTLPNCFFKRAISLFKEAICLD